MYIKTPSRRRCAGMSLAEYVIASGVSAIVLTVIAALIVYTARSFAALTNYTDLEYKSRNALDTLTSRVRQTRGVISLDTTNGILTLADTNNQPLRFEYVATNQTLNMVDNDGSTKVLLTNCTSCRFDIRQRNPKKAEWEQFPTAVGSANLTKLVQVTWTCSRELHGSKLFNTELIQTTKIVIRQH